MSSGIAKYYKTLVHMVCSDGGTAAGRLQFVVFLVTVSATLKDFIRHRAMHCMQYKAPLHPPLREVADVVEAANN